MRVLIIDDDEDVVFSLQTILCAKGVEVVGTGTDGSEAVKLYEELQPDILLMDIQMKPMNGLDEDGVVEMRRIFNNLKERGKLLILASHNKEDISILCDEVYEIKKGAVYLSNS